MSWHPVIALSQLKKENRHVFNVSGEKVLVLWHNDEVHAVQAQCPHLKLPLSNAAINQQNEIVCPFHKSAFDLCSGDVKCWSPWPAMLSGVLGKVSKPKNLKVYPVRIENEQIFINV